jgi:hypothetical protein
MVRGVTMGNTPVALYYGAAYPRNLVLKPANDNGAGREEMTVTIRRKLDKSGVTVRIKVPVAEFVGVAVGTRISPEGALTSTIELVHPNEEFNYQVYAENGNANAVAEWQNWGKKLRLPLYISAGDGSLVAYSQQVDGVMLGNQSGRRMLATDMERRTRFARRRKPGEKSA